MRPTDRHDACMPLRPSVSQLHNHLISSLSGEATQRLLAYLDLCELPLGHVLCKAVAPVKHVYFPIDAVISLLSATTDGHTVQIAAVGNEGMVGIDPLLGACRSKQMAVVQCAGQVYCLNAQAALAEFHRHSEFMTLVLRFTQSLVGQIAQNAACITHHSLQPRLGRWLLHALDRSLDQHVAGTHELIGTMLGVRREGVTAALRSLQSIGVIEHYRGHTHVVDRDRLEELSCDCYQVVKDELQRLHEPQ